jgi:hypothetical protein
MNGEDSRQARAAPVPGIGGGIGYIDYERFNQCAHYKIEADDVTDDPQHPLHPGAPSKQHVDVTHRAYVVRLP